jgi:hypothetical protein
MVYKQEINDSLLTRVGNLIMENRHLGLSCWCLSNRVDDTRLNYIKVSAGEKWADGSSVIVYAEEDKESGVITLSAGHIKLLKKAIPTKIGQWVLQPLSCEYIIDQIKLFSKSIAENFDLDIERILVEKNKNKHVNYVNDGITHYEIDSEAEKELARKRKFILTDVMVGLLNKGHFELTYTLACFPKVGDKMQVTKLTVETKERWEDGTPVCVVIERDVLKDGWITYSASSSIYGDRQAPFKVRERTVPALDPQYIIDDIKSMSKIFAQEERMHLLHCNEVY